MNKINSFLMELLISKIKCLSKWLICREVSFNLQTQNMKAIIRVVFNRKNPKLTKTISLNNFPTILEIRVYKPMIKSELKSMHLRMRKWWKNKPKIKSKHKSIHSWISTSWKKTLEKEIVISKMISTTQHNLKLTRCHILIKTRTTH